MVLGRVQCVELLVVLLTLKINFICIAFHINLLEFLAAFVGLWIEVINNEKEYARFLSMTDSSSALAWLFKSNFDPNSQKIHSQIARKLATVTMEAEVALYSQHVPGRHNVVADSLSRDHHIDSQKLTFLLKQLYLSQAQENFHILEKIPNEISSWLECLKQNSINKMALPTKPIYSKIGTLVSGKHTLKDVVSMTSFWIDSVKKTKSSSCQATQQLFEEILMVQQESQNFSAKQFEPPLATYVRPLGRTFGPTQLQKEMEKNRSSSIVGFADISTKTQKQNIKNACPNKFS